MIVAVVIMMLMKMMVTTLMAVVEVNIMPICYSFVEIRIFDFDFGLQVRILTPSRVESVDRRSILRLETTINR